MVLPRFIFWPLALLMLSAGPVAAADTEITDLIDQLVEVAEPGFGYSVYYSGSDFLPYEGTGRMNTLVLGATHVKRSDTLRKIVEQGAAAVPSLIKHLDDKRPVKMKPVTGMMWMDFPDEYDFNRRTSNKAPAGVNRDSLGDGEHPDQHAITVGDLCYVALGQIVNRQFAASRYQPSGGAIVNSPTHSKRLRDAIIREWRGLTRESHKARLIEDFTQPDRESRQQQAYLRLAFYYPEAVEAVVVAELSKPTFDVFAIEAFCRGTLYKANDGAERQRLFDAFLKDHGNQSADGIREQLFDDLATLEAHEQGRLSPPLTRFGQQPRQLLVQLFKLPPDVKSADRGYVTHVARTSRARLIGMLVHDDSQKVGDLVKQLFLDAHEDAYFSEACLRCLAHRGYGDFLIEQLSKIDAANPTAQHLHAKWIEAIATSRVGGVREELRSIIKSTTNESYFMAALPAMERTDDPVILDRAKEILQRLPNDTQSGKQILSMVREQFPSESKEVFRSFLKAKDAQRVETVCYVLWNGDPLAFEILAPFLGDRRELQGFTTAMRVCDRAAYAISHAINHRDFPYDAHWPQKEKDLQIERLKRYCQEKAE